MYGQNLGRALARLVTALLACMWFATGAVSAQGQTGDAHAHEHGADDHDHADHDADDHDHEHGDADHADHDHDHDAAGLAGIRLLLGQAGSPRAYVISAEDGAVLGTFSVPGAARVEQLADTRYGALVHTEANRVTFVYSGLSAVDHGDHMDLLLGNPYVLATVNTGRQPLHLASYGDDIAVFNEADGTVAWFDSRLLGASVDYRTIEAAPDHGALVPLGDHIAIGLLSAGTVEVHGGDGKLAATFTGCGSVHGQALLDDQAVFGCANGVMLVRELAGGVFTADLLPNPGMAQGARVSSLVSTGAERYVVGNYGNGFAVIDPAARTFVAYEAEGTQLGGVLFDGGERFARLGSDGRLRSFDLASGAQLGSVAVTDELGQGAPRPAITSVGDLAFVTYPNARAVVVVDLDSMTIADRLELDFRPDGIALLRLPGAVLH